MEARIEEIKSRAILVFAGFFLTIDPPAAVLHVRNTTY